MDHDSVATSTNHSLLILDTDALKRASLSGASHSSLVEDKQNEI